MIEHKRFLWLVEGLFILLLGGCAQGLPAQGASPPPPTQVPAPNPSSDVAAEDLLRISDEGGVVVEVTPLNLGERRESLDFQIALDTHSVELDYDLLALATLRDDQGNSFLPTAWDGPRGGHHLSGTLRFSRASEIQRSGVTFLELELRDIGGVATRVFRWTLAA